MDALYIEMGDSAMVFQVRWWIESYRDTRLMFDKVHMALPHALDDAGNDSPLPDADAQSPDKLGDGGSDLAQIRRAEAEISWNWTWVEACRQSIPPEHQRWKA